MSFFYLIKRYIALFIIFFILGFWTWIWYLYIYWIEANVKTQLFLTIAVKSDNSSIYEIEEASVNFWETIIWWFRNPSFISEIIWDMRNQKINISAFKQERQNMIIEIISNSKDINDYIIKSSYIELNKKITEFNDTSNVKYMTLDQGKITKISYLKNYLIPWFLWILLLSLAIFLVLIYEFLLWAVSSTEQIEYILWTKILDFFESDLNKNDYTLISVAIQKMKPLVILAWVNIDTDVLAVSITHRQSFFGEKIALVDWDLKRRTLQNTLWLSSRLKTLKWYTDIDTIENWEKFKQDLNNWEESQDMIVLQNTLDENIKFVPAWTWNNFLVQVFSNIAQKMKTIIHTQLPDNIEVLRLKNADLVLVVKLWKTRVWDLKRIKEVWEEWIRVVVIK